MEITEIIGRQESRKAEGGVRSSLQCQDVSDVVAQSNVKHIGGIKSAKRRSRAPATRPENQHRSRIWN